MKTRIIAIVVSVLSIFRLSAADSPLLLQYFQGHDRALAKTSITRGHVEEFSSVLELLCTLPADDRMRGHSPKISKGSPRVSEELRLVEVEAWLYAVKQEEDNDFHLILGTDPNVSPRRFLTAEVTGLPQKDAVPYRTYRILLNARRDFLEVVPAGVSRSAYKRLKMPIHIEVKGPLFFDIDHPAGAVGPKGLKPATAWEIHPVMEIEVLED